MPSAGVIRGTLDWHDDPVDLYRLTLHRGEMLVVDSNGQVRGTVALNASDCSEPRASMPIGRELRYVARCSGTHVLRLAASAGARGPYRLAIHRN
jgi:hypothetical protein